MVPTLYWKVSSREVSGFYKDYMHRDNGLYFIVKVTHVVTFRKELGI